MNYATEKAKKNNAKGKSFLCSKCSKPFSTKFSMQRHEKDCGVEVSRVSCNKCGRSLKNNDILEKHQLICFGLTKKLVCGHCDELFCSTFSLRRHLYRFHRNRISPARPADRLELAKNVKNLRKYEDDFQNREIEGKHKKILNFTLAPLINEDNIKFRYQMDVCYNYEYLENGMDPLQMDKAVVYPLKRISRKQSFRY